MEVWNDYISASAGRENTQREAMKALWRNRGLVEVPSVEESNWDGREGTRGHGWNVLDGRGGCVVAGEGRDRWSRARYWI